MARMSAEERRAVLVDAALAVMKRQGVANTSTRDIVAEAGMQIGVFHYCFDSKEQLVREVMRVINERTGTAVGEAVADVEPGAAFVRAAVAGYWHHIAADPNEHLLTYELTTHALRDLRAGAAGDGADVVAHIKAHDGTTVDAAVSQYDNYLFTMKALLTMLAEVCGTSWRTSVDRLTRVTLAMIEGITLQWLVDGDDDAARSSLDRLADILVDDAGLG